MKRILIFLVAISIIGCNYVDKSRKPENLISEDKMVDILYDVFILTSAKGTSKGILETNGIYPENYVFEKHKIDSLQFVLSNEYYGFRVEEYEAIITRVEERFSAKILTVQAKIDKEAADKQRQKDSIRKLSDTRKVNKSRKFQEPRK
tara:strand:- start:1344 stop:1787 length:444 start_codon:yes stop_codon:yes gene_type:complete